MGLGAAISKAEGFGALEPDGVTPNLPTRCNNPGDLERGDVGFGIDDGKTVYGNVTAGWEALYIECALMLSGKSRVYSPQDTLLAVAIKYTGNDDPQGWALIVSKELNLSPQSRLTDWLAA